MGILCESEELATEYITNLVQVMERAAKELSLTGKFEGKVTLLPPKEISEEPT